MFICPTCHANLSKVQGNTGVFWECHSCKGRAITIAALRKTLTRDAVNALWQGARDGAALRRRTCPSCLATMTEVRLVDPDASLTADVCMRCHIVWFDAHEFDQLPAIPLQTKSYADSLSQEAREKIAIAQIRMIQERADGENADHSPDTLWKYIPALLGLPVKHTGKTMNSIPWITCGLALTTTIVGFAVLFGGDPKFVFNTFGLIPANVARMYGVTLFTSTFLHGDIWHLLSNMYFLLLFGGDAEERLGKTRFIMLFLFAALTGDIAHVLFEPRSEIPSIGASGAISGIITFYALSFPRARFSWTCQYGLLFRRFWFSFSARVMFVFWFGLQAVGIWTQINGNGDVSALAHVGGCATGALFWAVEKWRERQKSLNFA